MPLICGRGGHSATTDPPPFVIPKIAQFRVSPRDRKLAPNMEMVPGEIALCIVHAWECLLLREEHFHFVTTKGWPMSPSPKSEAHCVALASARRDGGSFAWRIGRRTAAAAAAGAGRPCCCDRGGNRANRHMYRASPPRDGRKATLPEIL